MGSQARSACADWEELAGLRCVPARHSRRRPPDDGGLEGISCDADADLLRAEGIFVRAGHLVLQECQIGSTTVCCCDWLGSFGYKYKTIGWKNYLFTSRTLLHVSRLSP